jgi:arsenite methyltransferase
MPGNAMNVIIAAPDNALRKLTGVRMDVSTASRADYGVDAPPVIRNLAIVGLVCIAAGLVLSLLVAPLQPVIAAILLIWGLAAGVSMLVTAGLMVWSSKVGKLREREHLIDSLALRGDEIVLDVGCGRGLLLMAAARRLTSGKAIGIDLWQSQDQSGNRLEVALANAQAEHVAEHVEIKTGDMQALPFPDTTIDVVVSSLAIHNIPTQAGRTKAVQEIARVLKPNGRVALLDFQATADYTLALQQLGWQDVKRSRLRFAMFPPVRVVTGRKPD